MADGNIAEVVRNYVRGQFFSEEDRDSVTDQTALVTTGVLSSIELLEFVSFLEQTFHVAISSADLPALDTIERIVELVQTRQSAG